MQFKKFRSFKKLISIKSASIPDKHVIEYLIRFAEFENGKGKGISLETLELEAKKYYKNQKAKK